jgi:hypothetical protein
MASSVAWETDTRGSAAARQPAPRGSSKEAKAMFLIGLVIVVIILAALMLRRRHRILAAFMLRRRR